MRTAAMVSWGGGLWGMPSTPGPAHKHKILCVFFQKRAIELQAAGIDDNHDPGTISADCYLCLF